MWAVAAAAERLNAQDLGLLRGEGAEVRSHRGARRSCVGRDHLRVEQRRCQPLDAGQGGRIEVLRVKPEDGKKMGAGEYAAAGAVAAGTFLGT